MSIITLGNLLEKYPERQSKNVSVLEFPNSKITKIGTIPQHISSQLQSLNLSNNSLKQLQGIEQFKKLQSLNLKNNKISKAESLLELKNLLHLKKIYLQGNSFLENPLTEQILSLLSSFHNDLQILNYAFVDPQRQALVNQHRRSKSQSRVLSVSNAKSLAGYQESGKDLQNSKLIQKSKVNLMISTIKDYIEEKHEQHQISSYEIDKPTPTQQPQIISHKFVKYFKAENQNITPARKSPRFTSFPHQKNTSLTQPKTKKRFSKNLFSSNIHTIQENPPRSTVNKKKKADNVSWEQSIQDKNLNISSNSPDKKFKYQVDNLKIDLDLNNGALNYPSIIQKEDQDSFEIQFDFMSPSKISKQNKKQAHPISPSVELKQITQAYLKIQDQESASFKNGEKIQPKKQLKISNQPVSIINRPSISSSTLSMLTKSKALSNQKKPLQKISDKQNISQKISQPPSPLNMVRKGSLFESARFLIPQSIANDFIGKLLNKSVQQSQSMSLSYSLSEIIQNGEKFQKFYYKSLTRLKPAFNLLYSPFSSLKPEEKDFLLQELFKNHKQIFILLIKQFHQNEKLSEQLDATSLQAQKAVEQASRNQELNKKINQYEEMLSIQEKKYQKLEMQKQKLQKYTLQFQDILASRQKIIKDVKSEFEKINKTLIKKQNQFQKCLNQDQIEEQIILAKQKRIKSHTLKLINENALWTSSLRAFIQKRQNKQKVSQQRHKNRIKTVVFQNFIKNLNKEKTIRQINNKINQRTINQFFNQWKTQAKCQKLSDQLFKMINLEKKKQTLLTIHKFYLSTNRKKKTKKMVTLKILKNVFYKGFLKNYQMNNQRLSKLSKASLELFRIKIIKKYFANFKSAIQKQQNDFVSNQTRIEKEVIQKNQFALFRKIIQFQKKEQVAKVNQIQRNSIRQNEIRLFISNLKKMSKNHKKLSQNLIKAKEFRQKKFFNPIKKLAIKNVKMYVLIQKVFRKVTHQTRLKRLVTQFKEKSLTIKCQNNKKQNFFSCFSRNYKSKLIISSKKLHLISQLNFRRGLKAKSQFISQLRHFNIKKKIYSKQMVLEHHYLDQQSKYKQSHQLNVLTMQQLKEEINTCLGQIEFYKTQVQKLSQRELLILQQKQMYLLDIQSKEQQNLQLKRAILQNQERLQELQRKYQKSLDMYAQAIKNSYPKSPKVDRKAFFYQSQSKKQTQQPVTFRRQPVDLPFSSLRR